MTKAGKWKLGLGIGCSFVLLVVVGVLGVTTWYAGRINAEYKEVRDSEKILLAATEADDRYRPPAGGIPSPGRLEVFLAVREDLDAWRRTMATASDQFAADQERQRAGGFRSLVKLVYTGSDLMPVYAGFWTARNEALLAHEMGPGEYAYIYRLAYGNWLDLGLPQGMAGDFQAESLDEALGPFRDRLMSAYHPDVDPVELIFQMDRE